MGPRAAARDFKPNGMKGAFLLAVRGVAVAGFRHGLNHARAFAAKMLDV